MNRRLTFLNETGDVTLTWDESADDAMMRAIEQKMKEGMIFYIVDQEQRHLPVPPKIKLVRAKDATKVRSVTVRDDDFVKLIEAKLVEIEANTEPPPGERKVRRGRTAREVATAPRSVAVRARAGG